MLLLDCELGGECLVLSKRLAWDCKVEFLVGMRLMTSISSSGSRSFQPSHQQQRRRQDDHDNTKVELPFWLPPPGSTEPSLYL